MGSFDTLVGTCPKCGAEYEGQTKMTGCSLSVFGVGDIVDFERYPIPESIELKDRCACGFYPVAVFDRDKFLGFEAITPEVREGHYASEIPPGVDREEFSRQQTEDFIAEVEALIAKEKKGGADGTGTG